MCALRKGARLALVGHASSSTTLNHAMIKVPAPITMFARTAHVGEPSSLVMTRTSALPTHATMTRVVCTHQTPIRVRTTVPAPRMTSASVANVLLAIRLCVWTVIHAPTTHATRRRGASSSTISNPATTQASAPTMTSAKMESAPAHQSRSATTTTSVRMITVTQRQAVCILPTSFRAMMGMSVRFLISAKTESVKVDLPRSAMIKTSALLTHATRLRDASPSLTPARVMTAMSAPPWTSARMGNVRVGLPRSAMTTTSALLTTVMQLRAASTRTTRWSVTRITLSAKLSIARTESVPR